MRIFSCKLPAFTVGWFLVIYLLMMSDQLNAQQDHWQNVDRIVAIGDLHGDYEQYIRVMRDAGLINRRGNWIAGETHFVQLGDVPDRGPGTDRIIRHMQKLEAQAARAGGKVHALLGNHEVMNIGGDLRYVHPGEYEALTSSRSRDLRNAYYERTIEHGREQDPGVVLAPDHREQWNRQFPLGYVEHRTLWNPQGEFGSWVVQHNAVITINRTLFVHGGISAQTLSMSIPEINETIRTEIQDQPGTSGYRLAEDENGPLWYRGLAINDEEMEGALVQRVLDAYDVDHIVIAHTPKPGVITPRFGGKVLIIDVGISSYYGANNASLLIEGGRLLNVQRGVAVEIPTGNQQLLPYFERLAELEPDSERLQGLVRELQDQAGANNQ